MNWTRFTLSKKNGTGASRAKVGSKTNMTSTVQIVEPKLRETKYHAMCYPAMNIDVSVSSSLREFKVPTVSRQGTKDLRCDVEVSHASDSRCGST